MMGRRQKLVSGDEWDAISKWRRYMGYLQRPRVRKSIKRKINRRARRDAKRDLDRAEIDV